MEFKEQYGSPVGLAKKLELRWFQYPQLDSCSTGSMAENRGADAAHGMPFLHRTLSYAREERLSNGHGFLADVNVNTKPKLVKRKEFCTNTHLSGQEHSATKSRKKVDLLFKIFKHRIVSYNDALLSSPRRATRASSASAHRGPEDNSEVAPATPTSHHVLDVQDNLETEISKEKNDNGKRPLTSNSGVSGVVDTKPGELMSPLSFSQEVAVAGKRASPVFPSLKHGRGSISNPQGDGNISFSTVPQTKMFFYYLYTDKGNIPACQTEVQENSRRCPLCFVDATSDAGILMHCKTTHGESFSFDAVRSEEGSLHITVTVNPFQSQPRQREKFMNFVFVRSALPPKIPAIPCICRSSCKAAMLDLVTRKRKLRLLQERGADSSTMQRYVPGDQQPLRQYYHSRTNLPMLEEDWRIDSDDEPDESWLHKMSGELLDEFEDVSANEKRFMKIWNRFVKSHTVIKDDALPKLCDLFVRWHKTELKRSNLRQNLLLHLSNLWDTGLISSAHLEACLVEYDSR